MARAISKVAPEWWDYTTLDEEILGEAARIDEKKLLKLSRPGFRVHFYETLEEFYLAEALDYIDAWRQATPSLPWSPRCRASRSGRLSNCPLSPGSSTAWS